MANQDSIHAASPASSLNPGVVSAQRKPWLWGYARQPAQLAMLGIVLLGFALRLHRLGVDSLWLDELGQASMASGTLKEAIAGAGLHHGAAPLDYIVTWLALHVAAVDFAARLPAALVGTATIALLYRLGRALFDPAVGLVAALLVALSPFHLRFSQEARFYALFTALTVASALALVAALRRNDRRGWLAYALILIASLYAHYYTPLVVLTQGLAVLVAPRSATGRSAAGNDLAHRQAIRGFLSSCLVAAVAFVPWLIYAVLSESGVPRGDAPAFGLDLLRQIHLAFVAGTEPQEPLVPLQWIYLALAVAGMLAGLARRHTRWSTLLLVLPLLLAPPLIVLGLRLIGYFFALRQVLFLLPFYLLLVAYGALWLVRQITSRTRDHSARRWFRTAAALGLALVLCFPLLSQGSDAYQPERQDWRAAMDLVSANIEPSDAIVVPGVPDHYFRYYAPDWAGHLAGQAIPVDLEAIAADHPAVWVVAIPQVQDMDEDARRWLLQSGALQLDFGWPMQVYYWQPGRTVDNLLAMTQTWTPPLNPQALQGLMARYEDAGWAEAADAMAQQAAGLAYSPEDASEFQALRGNIWRRLGSSQDAIAAYQQAVDLWPRNVDAHIGLGEQLLRNGEAAEAAKVLRRAVSLDPGNYWARRLLADARWQQGRQAAAIAGYRSAIAIDPTVAETYARLGNLLEARGDTAGAIAAFEQYLERMPDTPQSTEIRQRLERLKDSRIAE